MEEKNKFMVFQYESKIPISSDLKKIEEYISSTMSKEFPVLTIDVDYFIFSIFSNQHNNLFKYFDYCLLTSSMEAIYGSLYQVVSSKTLRAIKSNRKIVTSKQLLEFLKEAEVEANNLGDKELDTKHIFMAIIKNEDDSNKIRKLFYKAGIRYETFNKKIKEFEIDKEIFTEFLIDEKINNSQNIKNKKRINKEVKIIDISDLPQDDLDIIMDKMGGFMDNPITGNKKAKGKYISSYCTNLNALAMEGKIDALVGREKEFNEIVRILGRKKKNNAILLGGEGVGKTAIGESLAYKIVHNEVPDFLSDKTLVSLDMTALMAGTTLRGMFEERVKGILDEIKADPSIILFMDNIGAILADKGKNDYEISAMLARALENGEIQVIGTSDFTSYRKTFDKDPSLARRFQKIIVEAPTIEESLKILNGLKPTYEKFHGVKYEDEAINSCVLLANRYISERNLPDSAIDILDEIGSLKGTIQESEEVKNLREALKQIKFEINEIKTDKDKTLLIEKEEIYDKIEEEYKNKVNDFKKERLENPVTITKDDILNIVSIKTNIPVNNLTSDDKKKLIDMNNRIKEKVIGQDGAIDIICKALKRNRIGLNKNGCMYSAMLIGRTGVGKTLIAKQLAKELFGDEKALVRFDMSEFSDKVAVNKLIGSNPGYVGYEEGGQLTEKIKNKKHCVLLLDEIEKADPEIYNIFLQILDEGFLTDNSGQKVDFKNVIVLFTSNIGAKSASDFGKGIGFNEDIDGNTKKILLKELKKKFPPEFLNRIDNTINFNSLTEEDIKVIINIEIKKFESRLNNIGYNITYNHDVIDYIYEVIKDEKEYGARPIHRAIQNTIEDKITDVLLEDDYKHGYTFNISCATDFKELIIS